MDVREAIILRLMAICEVTSGFVVHRNRTAIPEDQRPCIVVLDGDEETEEQYGRNGMSPSRVTMTPAVVALVEDDSEDVGTVLNALRAQIIYAILSDSTLTNLTLNNDGPRYLGMAFATEAGRKISGQAEIQFGLSYLLNPADLSGL